MNDVGNRRKPLRSQGGFVMINEKYKVDSVTEYDIEIVPAPADGKKHPVVVLVHGNLGLQGKFGKQLRDFTEQIGAMGYVAALPSYYPGGVGDIHDTDVAKHSPALVAAIKHLAGRKDAEITRLALVGFSLGGGVATDYINSNPAGTVKVFADFYGFVGALVAGGVANFPPTITFSNNQDPVVPPSINTSLLIQALQKAKIDCEPHWYDDNWEVGFGHAFEPGKHADNESRDLTKKWLRKYMPPI